MILRPFLAALLLALSFPPFSIWPLAWPAYLVFLLPFLKINDSSVKTRKSMALHCGIFFYFVNLLGFYWLAYTLHEFGALPWLAAIPITLLLFALFSLLPALWGYFWPLVSLRVSARARPLLLVVWLMLLEFFDLRLFPWAPPMTVGAVQTLLASVFYLGTWGWCFIFFCSSVYIATQFLAANFSVAASCRKFALRSLACLGLCLAVGWVAGLASMKNLKARYSAVQPVVLFQGNVGNYEKKLTKLGVMPTVKNVLSIHRALLEKAELYFNDTLTGSAAERPETWVFWPETSFPGYPLGDPDSRDLLASWARITGGLHILGAYELALAEFAGRKQKMDFNIVTMFNESQGYVNHYQKRIRVPFGEYIPGDEWFPSLYQLFPAVNHFAAGSSFSPLPHADPSGPVFVPLVCYEILYHGFVSRFVSEARRLYPQRSLIIVNPTNDSWYGPTSEPFQHSLLARWSVAEQGLPALRPTNTGLSQIIAPWGEVLAGGVRDEAIIVSGELPVERVQLRLAH